MLDDVASKSLPLAGAHAGRSARLCALKCGSACFHEVPNRSDNAYFGDVVAATVSRRGLLKGAGAVLVLAGVPSVLAPPPASAGPRARSTNSGTGLTFAPIPPTDGAYDDVVVPDGYDWELLIRWGDPVEPHAPAWDYANQTAAAQAKQFGYNCDYIGFLATGHGNGVARSRRGLLVVNHEYTEPDRMFPGYTAGAPTKEQVDIELAAHGMSVLDITRDKGNKGAYAVLRGSRYNRRVTATTPLQLTGPAAGHELLRTAADPSGTTVLGTLNNCAGGSTPWGTILSAEENFNQYFANAAALPDGPTKTAHARYGVTTGASERRWETYYPRFDVAQEPNEPYRFGWVVEIDPSDPTCVPRKRTALGRFKHEAATIALADDGRVVAYMGDDERFDYVYKFVSRDRYREGDKAHNLTLLDDGDLYVARFTGDSPAGELERYNAPATLGQLPDDGEFDGSGSWIPLILGGASQVPGFSVAEVLIKTRLAADAVGATKMDRPEDVERNPVNGRVYLAMTNNTRRGVGSNPGIDEANPQGGLQRRGHGQQVRPHRRAHRNRQRPCGNDVRLAAVHGVRQPVGRDHVLGWFPARAGQPRGVPRQRGVRRQRQPVDRDRRRARHDRQGRRLPRRPGQRPRTRTRAPVPVRPCRRRSLRP